nr:C40 family peptidase [Murinocardiopsis flavida]
MAFAVVLGGFAPPAWADPVPNVQDRPPVDAQTTEPRAAASGEGAQRGTKDAPPVADTRDLKRDVDVAEFDKARSRQYFAAAADTLSDAQIEKVRGLKGVKAVEVVDAARVQVEGEATSVLGVDPSTFRNFAPKPSAKSDEVWQGIAEGRIALSNDAGKQRGLKVGSDVTVAGGKGEVRKEVWTHATSGVAGIDALVSRESAAAMGFPEGNALVVSAPKADLWKLKDDLTEALGEDVALQLLAENPEPRPSDAKGDAVGGDVVESMISAAESQKGVPYVWGGETPDGGFDCSGLVQWAFAKSGVAVPRVTHDQWYAGEHVELADAERGDLIFWRSDPTAPDYISHVAIYLGDGKMLEAPRTGDVVKETDVRTAKLAGVVRVHT